MWRTICEQSTVPTITEASGCDDLCFAGMSCTPEHFGFARGCFERALQIDPNFAPALMGLHALLNWTPALFFGEDRLSPKKSFLRDDCLRRLESLPRSSVAATEEFFVKAHSRDWGNGVDKEGRNVIPAAVWSTHGVWLSTVTLDLTGAFRMWETAANLLYPPASNSLAVFIASARVAGESRDIDRAVALLRAGAAQGHANSLRNLGRVLRMEFAYNRQLAEESLACTKAASDMGLPSAILDLATCYRKGILGLGVDVEESTRLLRLSAASGNPYAQLELGLALKNGNGVPQDLAAAVEYISMAVEQENQVATLILADMYLLGQGVPASHEKHLELTMKVAMQGDSRAAFTAGVVLHHENSAEAIVPLSICYNNDDDDYAMAIKQDPELMQVLFPVQDDSEDGEK